MFFVEIIKMSGMKTYFGYEMEELFYPKEMLKKEWGFKSRFDAEDKLQQINVMMSGYGIAVSKVEIIEI